MKKNKGNIFFGIVAVLTTLTGCGSKASISPIQISADTTFQQVFQADGWFRAIFVWPLVKIIDFFTGIVGPIGSIIMIAIIINLILLAFSYRNSIRVSAARIKFNPHRKEYDKDHQINLYQDMQKVYTHFHASKWKVILNEVIQLPIIIALYISINSSSALYSSTVLGVRVSTPMIIGIALKNPVCLTIFIGMLFTQLFVMFAPVIHDKKSIVSSFNPVWWIRFLTVFIFGLSLPAFVSIYYAVFNIISIFKNNLITENAYKLAIQDTWDLTSTVGSNEKTANITH